MSGSFYNYFNIKDQRGLDWKNRSLDEENRYLVEENRSLVKENRSLVEENSSRVVSIVEYQWDTATKNLRPEGHLQQA